MQCEEWADANSELFKEAHDETVHKNSYKRKLYELISASLGRRIRRERFLRLMGPSGPKVLRFDGPLARGLWYRPAVHSEHILKER